jgi:hypothetical protein
MIPAGLAIFLQLATLKPRTLGSVLAFVYAVSIIYGTNRLNSDDWYMIKATHDGRQRWRHAYWKTHDQVAANQLSGFLDTGAPVVGPQLKYLEAHHRNLFKSHP